MTRIYLLLPILILFSSCQSNKSDSKSLITSPNTGIELIVLGTLQDGGLPHIGCKKKCCAPFFNNPHPAHKVVSLGIIDYDSQNTYILEATPDFTEQIEFLTTRANFDSGQSIPDGIFISHAHIGHYTGLMFLGKEAKNANQAQVYCMPGMENFLTNHGPWSQLVTNKNIIIKTLKRDTPLKLSPNLSITPFIVPHRDEFSETVGFKINGPHKTVLFIPDIDKWSKWEKMIIEEISKVDYAFIDGTFYDAEEINYRDIKEIPHPFVIESMELFNTMTISDKSKVHFIHLNHTNPLNIKNSSQYNTVRDNGFNIAEYSSSFPL